MKKKRERMQRALAEARAICDLAEKEGRDFTADERQKVDGLLKAATLELGTSGQQPAASANVDFIRVV